MFSLIHRSPAASAPFGRSAFLPPAAADRQTGQAESSSPHPPFARGLALVCLGLFCLAGLPAQALGETAPGARIEAPKTGAGLQAQAGDEHEAMDLEVDPSGQGGKAQVPAEAPGGRAQPADAAGAPDGTGADRAQKAGEKAAAGQADDEKAAQAGADEGEKKADARTDAGKTDGKADDGEKKPAAKAEAGEGGSPYSAEAMKLWPSVDSLVTSPFGAPRQAVSLTGGNFRIRYHSGLDIRAHLGWPVRTMRSGVVIKCGAMGNAGLVVQVRQKDGKTVSYAHLSKILVKDGQKVVQGQHIGLVGCTGRTTGAHLHLTIRNKDGQRIDPRKEIKGLWELFDPPLKDISSPIRAQACSGKYGQAGMAGRHPNKRLYGTKQYLRMRKALTDINNYKIPDIVTWESMHKK